ncbi:MAG TPA: signal peptide peptidase SppA [Flavipsychrobacter sp.]|nr:signal peptide peptidase SppA [Flavipsychrobacter sp.]
MRQFFKMFFASALAIIITSAVVIFIIIGMIVGATKSVTEEPAVSVNDNSVLVIDLDNTIHEQSQSNSFAALSDGNSFTPGLFDVIRAIEFAQKDEHIKGILLKVAGSPSGWATMQQVRSALEKFKESKKFIFAYAEGITQKSYYIANVADAVYLNPVGGFELKGLASQIPFFKGTLSKLEVQPEIFYAGKFKSATEPFREEKMSEPNKVQIREYQNDIWNTFLLTVATKTGADTAAIHQWANTGAIQFPADAVSRKLVSEALYWDEVEGKIREKLGKKEDEKINYLELDEYANYVRTKRKIEDTKIAVLFAEGSIVDGESTEDYQIASKNMIEEIRRIKKNDKVKAVVLRINSGGGSALASEVILRELQLLHAKKPLIVSMGDVAASGGYYIACQADSIFALPTTLTGSIGVFTMLFNTGSLWKNKLGITFDEVKNSAYADFPSAIRALSAEEAQRMQAGVDTIYHTFKSRVAKARHMSMEAVDSIAQGRVWTGEDAKAIGLVDELGDLNRAIASAAKKANLKSYQVITYPEPIDEFQSMLRRFKGAGISSAALKTMMEKDLEEHYELIKKIKSVYHMNGRAQMAMPFQMTEGR